MPARAQSNPWLTEVDPTLRHTNTTANNVANNSPQHWRTFTNETDPRPRMYFETAVYAYCYITCVTKVYYGKSKGDEPLKYATFLKEGSTGGSTGTDVDFDAQMSSDNKKITFFPKTALSEGTYSYGIWYDLSKWEGFYREDNGSIYATNSHTFVVDRTAPTATFTPTTIITGARDPIYITFSEKLYKTSAGANPGSRTTTTPSTGNLLSSNADLKAAFIVKEGGSSGTVITTFTASIDTGANRVTLTPTADWSEGDLYVELVTTKIFDRAGNSPAAANHTYSVDTQAPTVTASSSGYYKDANLTKTLTRAAVGKHIYTQGPVQRERRAPHQRRQPPHGPRFSTRSPSAPSLGSFDIVAAGTTLADGDCRPDAAHPADVYECMYTVKSSDSGAFRFRVGTNTKDVARLALAATYTHAKTVVIDKTAPTVTASASGYYSDANLTKSLARAMVGTDIYTKVTFSEDMDHVVGDSTGARPVINYKIGSGTAQQFDIVAAGTTLATGDCRPDAANSTDVYECMHTVVTADSTDFGFEVGAASEDLAGNAISAYTHTAKVVIDKTAPTFSSARIVGKTLTVIFNEAMGSEKAANAQWNVQVTPSGGSAARRNVTATSMYGSEATLTLASSVILADTVTVAYTNPGGSNDKQKDVAGNALASFTARASPTTPSRRRSRRQAAATTRTRRTPRR